MRRSVRTYTVDEANRVLPEVRRLAAQIAELSEQLPELQDQVRIAEYRLRRRAAGQDDADLLERRTGALRSTEDDLTEALGRMGAIGVSLKDPRQGLVDFYSEREGELIELCWKLGEDHIAHWHRIGEGFAGRQRITW